MVIQTAPTNREVVETKAIALAFSLVKSSPLVPTNYAGKSGTVTFGSIRTQVRKESADLSGDKLTARVNEIRTELDASAMAGVLKLNKEGFYFTRFNGRQLKNGSRNVSIGMSNAADSKATPSKKIGDYTSAELLELAKLAEQAEKAAKTPTIDI